MYTLNEYLPRFLGNKLPEKGWDEGMYCLDVNAEIIFRTNLMQGFVYCYAFVLVDSGSLTILYNGKELTLLPNDLCIYSPCIQVTVVAASDDFHGYCLMVDERVSIEAPSVHDLVHMAHQPIVQLHQPKQTLTAEVAAHLLEKMREIISYLHTDHIYKNEVLRMLYSIFMLDLQNAQNHSIARSQTPQRVEEIFFGFIRLLPDNEWQKPEGI